MARFVAKYAKYRHGVRTGRFMVLGDGQRQELAKELFAKFERSVPREDEIKIAITQLQHTGLPIDKDTEEHFSPRSRISGFDSEAAQERYGWTDEERELVEQVLRSSDAYGREFLEVGDEVYSSAKPWQNYDNITDAFTIVDLVKLTGVPVEQVIAYEKHNANREDVLEALERYRKGDKDDEEVVVIQA